MRVLIVADVVGGVRTFVDELTWGLATRGVEVHLAMLGAEPPRAAPAAASCETRDLKLEWMSEPWADIEATSKWVDELIAHVRPDLVHMNTFASVLHPSVPVMLTVHSCVMTWWRAVHGVEAPAGWTRYRHLVKAALDRAAVVCSPTGALLDELTSVYGELPPTEVIPNGRELRPTHETCDGRLVVTVGRLWDEAKNAALVARAASAIAGRVVMIGPGSFGGLEGLGALPSDEVVRWLSRAAVFTEPARYEPFGLAALEAALCGCALVLGDIPSLREVWSDAASYVAPGDADALADAINALLESPDSRRRAANAAQARAGVYTREAMTSAYLNQYLELARPAVSA
jgi:glycosyltransferase involved in cell wall biosynthesis